VDRELALIDSYARTLRERGLKLPWKAGQDVPDLIAIALATSIPRERLRTVGALRAAIARLIAEFRPDASEQTFDAELARLTHHVERMLAGEIAVPVNAIGIFVAEIARHLGIAVHRLHTMPAMRAQIARLEAAGFGQERDAALARLRDHVDRAISKGTPLRWAARAFVTPQSGALWESPFNGCAACIACAAKSIAGPPPASDRPRRRPRRRHPPKPRRFPSLSLKKSQWGKKDECRFPTAR